MTRRHKCIYKLQEKSMCSHIRTNRFSIGTFSWPERNSDLLQSIMARISAIHVGTSRL